MKTIVLFLVGVVAVAGCTPASDPNQPSLSRPHSPVERAPSMGSWSTGGGDPLYEDLVDGQKLAPAILRRLNLARLGIELDAGASQWLRQSDRIEQLAQDIEHSPLNLAGNFDTCAHTDFSPKAEVAFTIRHCRGQIHSALDAAKWWIHEGTHHLQVTDDVLATSIASTVFRAWSELQLVKIEICPDAPPMVSDYLIGEWRVSESVNRAMGLEHKYLKRVERYSFKENPALLDTLPPIKTCAYRVGEMEVQIDSKTLRFPFALVSYRGQPKVVYFEKRTDGTWNLETLHLTVVHPGKGEEANTRLFLGGDMDYEGFTAFERI